MKKFKKGEIVILNSGGPKMTVESYKEYSGFEETWESPNEVVCTWFDNNGAINSRVFEQEALKRVMDE